MRTLIGAGGARRNSLIVAAACAALAGAARAGDRFYVGASGGNWSDVNNWSASDQGAPPAPVPVAGDNATIDPSASTTVNFDGDYASASPLLSLDVSGAGGSAAAPTATLSQSANTMSAATVTLGNGAGTSGGYSISGGTLNATAASASGPLIVGNGGAGLLSMSNTAAVNASGNVEVGLLSASTGDIEQTGGTFTVGSSANPGAASMFVGRNAGSTGTYHISQPSGASSLTIYGNLYAGYDGRGTVVQDGGAVHLVGPANGSNGSYLQIGANSAGSSGSYTINNGSLTTDGGDIDVGGYAGGANGSGSFIDNNGTVSVGGAFRTWSTGTSTINNGTVQVAVDTTVAGTLNLNGGSLNSPGSAPGLGLSVEKGGTFNINGGAVTVGAGGFRNDGTINKTGGSINLAGAIWSPTGMGVFNQTAGSASLADQTNISQGMVQINGGTATSPGTVAVGVTTSHGTGDATLAVSNGANVNFTGILGIGNSGVLTSGSGSGTLTVSGAGTSLHAHELILGSTVGGSGAATIGNAAFLRAAGLSFNDFTDNGGTVSIASEAAQPGDDPMLANSMVGGYMRNGAMNMMAGSVTVPNIKLGITSGNTGTYTQTGGTVSVGVLGVGNDATETGGAGTGTAALSAGTLYADTVLLGSTAGGSGTMTVSGTGALTVGGGLNYNDLNVAGGSVTVLDQNPPPGEDPVLNRSMVGGYLHDGAMYMNAGTASTPNLKVGIDHKGTYVQSGGIMSVTTQLIANQGANSIVTLNGGTMNLQAADINTGSPLTVGDGTHSFLLNLTGGTVSVAQGLIVSASGRLAGVGTISGNVTNNGNLAPGDAPGTITINGNLSSSGALDFGIVSPSSYDRISLPTGVFTAGGTIDVSLLGGYVPVPGNAFKIMDFAGILNIGYTFDFSQAPLYPGDSWDTSAFASSGIIDVIPEPGALSLFGISAAAMLKRRRK